MAVQGLARVTPNILAVSGGRNIFLDKDFAPSRDNLSAQDKDQPTTPLESPPATTTTTSPSPEAAAEIRAATFNSITMNFPGTGPAAGGGGGGGGFNPNDPNVKWVCPPRLVSQIDTN